MSSYWEMLKQVCVSSAVDKAFYFIDVDGSGQISSKDLRSLLETLNSYVDTGINPTDEQFEQMIGMADTDNNGTLSLEEVKALLNKLMGLEPVVPVETA